MCLVRVWRRLATKSDKYALHEYSISVVGPHIFVATVLLTFEYYRLDDILLDNTLTLLCITLKHTRTRRSNSSRCTP